MAKKSKTMDLQVEIAERLQLKLLQNYEAIIDDNTITAADRAALGRLLREGGWTLDPSKLPQSLLDKLPQVFTPADLLDDGDADTQGGAH